MESIGILFGLILALLFYLLAHFIIQRLEDVPLIKLDDPTDDADFHKLQNTPHCPDCSNTKLELIDNYKGVEFLRQPGMDGNFYYCPKCGRSFSNEDWENVKHYDIDIK